MLNRRFLMAQTVAVVLLMGALEISLQAENAPPAAAKPPEKLSESLNRSIPKWVSFSGEYRMRVEGLGGIGFKPALTDAYTLSRLRLNVLFKPTPWMRLMLQGQDAEVMARNAKPDAAPFQDKFDLRQAYVEIGNAETKSFALKVGRQELFFGEQRLIGHLNWTNTARSFDAVRATYRQGKARVDVFSASVVRFYDGAFNKRGDGDNIHGAYAVFNVMPNKGTLDTYVFWREQSAVKSEGGPLDKLDAETIGARVAGKFTESFDYSVEAAGQLGSVASDDVRAWAGRVAIGHTMAKARFKPRLVAAFEYASGDKDPTDGRRQTFDQLYPTGHDRLGLADQVGWRNIAGARAGIEMKLAPRLSMNSNYLSWWLADPHDALYNAAGAAIAKVAAGTAGHHVGQEGDIQAVFTLNSLFQIAGGYGHVFPGTFLKNATPGESYKFSYVMATYQF
ncbi:MAG TPA: alginate export family protein [Terriglobia bacterium]|nr:alginate export family protein [Terriglobia bacterium]